MPLKDTIKIKSISRFLDELGIKEKLPESNKHMDYSALDLTSIRLLNKIISYIDSNNISSVDEFIGQENIGK